LSSKPYTVHWKRQGEWVEVYSSHNPDDAMNYAKNDIAHGGITERIEIRDSGGALETVYDSTWGSA